MRIRRTIVNYPVLLDIMSNLFVYRIFIYYELSLIST